MSEKIEEKKVAEKEVEKEIEQSTSPAEGVKSEQSVPYERFQEVVRKRNEIEAKLAELLKEKKDAETKTLEEQKKFEELYKKASEELEQTKKNYEDEMIKNALIIEATKYKIIDVDAAYKLIDKSSLKVNGNTVENLKEAIEKLIKEKPYLIGKEQIYPLSGIPAKGEQLTSDAIEKMSMEQYAAWRKAQGGK